MPKDLEYLEAAQKAANYIKKFLVANKSYNQLFLVANPKMLGYLRGCPRS
jgi:protein required for attachment to host cells